MTNTNKKEKCLNPSCNKVSEFRGLCASCYRIARRLVAEKKISWDELIKQNKALPRQPRGVSFSPVATWLLDKNE